VLTPEALAAQDADDTEAPLGEAAAPDQTQQAFAVGDSVRVKLESEMHAQAPRWRKPHLRTPGYIHGARGVIERVCGSFQSPEALAFGGRTRPEVVPTTTLYRVRVPQSQLWTEAVVDAEAVDTVDVEVYQHWLEGVSADDQAPSTPTSTIELTGHGHRHGHGHGDSEHSHGTRTEVELNAVRIEEQKMLPEPRVSIVLLGALLQNGVIEAAALASAVETVERLGSLPAAGAQPDLELDEKGEDDQPGRVGAALVARAWVDDGFRLRLLADASSAAMELGLRASNATATTVLTVLENTPTVHNLVVCTLCSCYPLPILGLSPAWYKSSAYR
jgi:nitrile hydratase